VFSDVGGFHIQFFRFSAARGFFYLYLYDIAIQRNVKSKQSQAPWKAKRTGKTLAPFWKL